MLDGCRRQRYSCSPFSPKIEASSTPPVLATYSGSSSERLHRCFPRGDRHARVHREQHGARPGVSHCAASGPYLGDTSDMSQSELGVLHKVNSLRDFVASFRFPLASKCHVDERANAVTCPCMHLREPARPWSAYAVLLGQRHRCIIRLLAN